MRKKETNALDEEVCRGLHRVVGRRRISQFFASLGRLPVMDNDVDAAYQEMAQDEAREMAALQWAEATVGDVAGETR